MLEALFKAVSDRRRREILQLLRRQGTLPAGEIAQHFPISAPALSEHLKILREAGLVVACKRKQFVLYSLNTTVFEDLASWVAGFLDKEEAPDRQPGVAGMTDKTEVKDDQTE